MALSALLTDFLSKLMISHFWQVNVIASVSLYKFNKFPSFTVQTTCSTSEIYMQHPDYTWYLQTSEVYLQHLQQYLLLVRNIISICVVYICSTYLFRCLVPIKNHPILMRICSSTNGISFIPHSNISTHSYWIYVSSLALVIFTHR